MKTDPWVLLAANNDGGWNQKWTIKSNVARLLKHEDNPTQQWEADYVGLNYNFALLPGFPGIDEGPPFPDRATLKNAVTSYINEECADNSDCAIGKTWGYPMNTWNVGEITDFSYLFNGGTIDEAGGHMQTFNENIASWDTSKVCNCSVCVFAL